MLHVEEEFPAEYVYMFVMPRRSWGIPHSRSDAMVRALRKKAKRFLVISSRQKFVTGQFRGC